MELSKEIEDIISDAIHDVCEECIARHDCKRPCFEVVRMRQLAVDVVKAERERCVKTAQDWMCDNVCSFARVCGYRLENCTYKSQLRKAIEGGNQNESKNSEEDRK